MTGNKKIVLSNLYIETTSKCNLLCRHCYNSSGEADKEIDYTVLEKIILDAKMLGLDFLTISGGEPFLYSELTELMNFLKDQDLFFLIVTNGTCLNSEYQEKLLHYNCNIQLSLDGPDSESHDAIRGKGVFDQAITNIKRLRSIGFKGKIVIKGVITNKMNTDLLYRYKSIAEEVGASKVEFGWMNRTGRGARNYNELFIGAEKINQYIEMFNANKYEGVGFEISDIAYTDICPLVYQENEELLLSPKITYDGDVFSCQMFTGQEFSLGNIYNDTLLECLTSDRFQRLLLCLRERQDRMPACKTCIYNNVCKRGCPAICVNQGSLLSCDEFCSVRKKEFGERLFSKLKGR